MLGNGLCEGVFFDLDGTLVDTAPDMVAALHDLQRAHGLEPAPYEEARMHVSNGALGLLGVGFPGLAHRFGGDLHQEYLELYAQRVCNASVLFPGFAEILDLLDAAERPWGVVTNKPANLTNTLLDKLSLASRSACTVSGDTLPERKPHPAPLLHACNIAGLRPETTIYVGDAERDIKAGQIAGLATIAAAWGYVTPDDDPDRWGADLVAADTAELAQMLRKALNLEL